MFKKNYQNVDEISEAREVQKCAKRSHQFSKIAGKCLQKSASIEPRMSSLKFRKIRVLSRRVSGGGPQLHAVSGFSTASVQARIDEN